MAWLRPDQAAGTLPKRNWKRLTPKKIGTAVIDADALLQLRKYLQVAHHIPGRIRLKMKREILGDPRALNMARSVDLSSWNNGHSSAAVINTRLNPKAGSLVMDYDPSLLAPGLIEELFSVQDPERVGKLVDQLSELLEIKFNS